MKSFSFVIESLKARPTVCQKEANKNLAFHIEATTLEGNYYTKSNLQ